MSPRDWMVLSGLVFVASTGANVATVVWCRSIDDACIPVHGIVTVPAMVLSALMLVVGGLVWLMHRGDDR